jgi:hypothetical protein
MIYANDGRFYNLEFAYGSVDPCGYIYYETKVYRKISDQHKKSMIGIIEIIQNLDGIIKTKFVADSVVEHPYVPFISLISEWPPEAIRDAAILFIELQHKLSKHNLMIKDGHSFNIQFMHGKPIFIDIGSIIGGNYKKNIVWWDQFKDFFLRTLISFTELEFEKEVWTLDYDEMLDKLKSIRFKCADHGWSQYPQPDELVRPKDAIVNQLLQELPGHTLIDIGSNRGLYSKIAAKAGKIVVATDVETNSCNELYVSAKTNNLNILTLNHNIKSNYGEGHWGKYYATQSYLIRSSFRRLKCDSGIALAIVHHLARAGWSLEEIAKRLSSYIRHKLIVEFIPKEDEYVAGWPFPKNYSLETFVNILKLYWKTINVVDSSPSPRVFVVLSDKYKDKEE